MPWTGLCIVLCPLNCFPEEDLADDMQSELCGIAIEVGNRATIIEPFLHHHFCLLNSTCPNRLKVLVIERWRSDLFENAMLFPFSGGNCGPVNVEDIKHLSRLDKIVASGRHLHDNFRIACPEYIAPGGNYHYRIIIHPSERLVAFMPGLAPFGEWKPRLSPLTGKPREEGYKSILEDDPWYRLKIHSESNFISESILSHLQYSLRGNGILEARLFGFFDVSLQISILEE